MSCFTDNHIIKNKNISLQIIVFVSEQALNILTFLYESSGRKLRVKKNS